MPRSRFKITPAFRKAADASALPTDRLAHIGGLRREHLARHMHGVTFGFRVKARILIIADVIGVSADRAVAPCR